MVNALHLPPLSDDATATKEPSQVFVTFQGPMVRQQRCSFQIQLTSLDATLAVAYSILLLRVSVGCRKHHDRGDRSGSKGVVDKASNRREKGGGPINQHARRAAERRGIKKLGGESTTDKRSPNKLKVKIILSMLLLLIPFTNNQQYPQSLAYHLTQPQPSQPDPSPSSHHA